MRKKLYVILLILPILFSGCFGMIAAAGTAISAVSTSQEVEEDYDGNFVEYVGDKFDIMYEYVNKKIDDLDE